MRSPCLIAALLLSCTPTADIQQPTIVAHRGASRDAPENTIPAFRLAWQQGADAIEGDFRLTEDGHIVCIHDEDTQRVASLNLRVEASTLEELRRLDVGVHHSEEYRGTTIPTIAEVLALVPENGKIYVEIKSGPEIIPKLLDEITGSRLKPEQIVVIAFDEELIQALKTEAPQYQASWLVRVKKDKSGRLTPSLRSAIKTLRRIKADGLGSNKNVTERFARGVQKRGYDWHVWTVDDQDCANRFVTWGADSITTNVPGVIRQSLEQAESVRLSHPPRQ